MGLRPATPGFLVTLAATICLALVVFSVPWLKSVYFLRAKLNTGSIKGEMDFGVLGYCLDVGTGPQCSKPSIGYEFDPNAVLGITTKLDIPDVVVKWITYALVLHIVALVAAAVSALFGLLAHVREMSMVCCSTCFSGFAASAALFAFIFDIVFFFLVKSRINAAGGSAQLGTGIWLTLAAWVMLFFAGCFYGFGQCCIRNRSHKPSRQPSNHDNVPLPSYVPPYKQDTHDDSLRLDAIKAEQDRKARVKMGEGGLPAFQEHESKPLRTQYIEESDEEDIPHQPYRDGARSDQRREPSIPQSVAAATGYAAAPRGTRAIEEYYSPSNNAPPQPQPAVAYPPQPRQYQQNYATPHAQVASHYPEIVEPQPQPAAPRSPAPAMGHTLFASNYGHGQLQPTNYGHEARGTTFHSAHSQFPSSYSAYAEPQFVQGGQPYSQNAQSYGGYQSYGDQSYGASRMAPFVWRQEPQATAPGVESYYTANASTPSVPGGYPSSSPVPLLPTPPGIPAAQPYRNSSVSDASYYSQYQQQQQPVHPARAAHRQYLMYEDHTSAPTDCSRTTAVTYSPAVYSRATARPQVSDIAHVAHTHRLANAPTHDTHRPTSKLRFRVDQ
ncbi:pali-domain-containing protein [Auriculariales sp. MPI-PUGE-AT-0066]|nr:pali-domain-containing protein [Auriculariales sp. MPI-PUGE-AT-0066]